jgi:hypothetical protein
LTSSSESASTRPRTWILSVMAIYRQLRRAPYGSHATGDQEAPRHRAALNASVREVEVSAQPTCPFKRTHAAGPVVITAGTRIPPLIGRRQVAVASVQPFGLLASSEENTGSSHHYVIPVLDPPSRRAESVVKAGDSRFCRVGPTGEIRLGGPSIY